VAAGGVAGVMYKLANYPVDIINSELLVKNPGSYQGYAHCIKEVSNPALANSHLLDFEEEGFKDILPRNISFVGASNTCKCTWISGLRVHAERVRQVHELAT
jgi:hypothetical protein